jgi:S1-C subfamily serine protease
MESRCGPRTASLKDALSQNGRIFLVMLAIVSVLSGCVQSPEADAAPRPQEMRPRSFVETAVRSKLARVGLELVTERDAAIPERESGRYVPCRVLAGSSAPLAPDPAGYLIVGFDGQLADDASKILLALDHWRVGETISLWVRRNPFLAAEPGWWEVNDLPVTLR